MVKNTFLSVGFFMTDIELDSVEKSKVVINNCKRQAVALALSYIYRSPCIDSSFFGHRDTVKALVRMGVTKMSASMPPLTTHCLHPETLAQ